MVIKRIDLDSVQISLEQLLSELETDEEILLTKGDAPIAHIAAAKPKAARTKPRILGLHEGQGWISDDFTEELPDSFWLGEDE
jgi:antitoxin (DNA-binding transcriptional repressor) of toxin-antitoxin stability system